MSTNSGVYSEISHVSHYTRTIIDIRDLEKVLKKGCNHGVCGGHNLGNTCFMNSSIACLSNCTELTTYFLTGKYKQNINSKNKWGLGGKLANAWYDLLQVYWNSSSRAGNPSNVKSAVAKIDKKFAGFGQQDSNEFMTEFLSILSEDLNKADKKIYKELSEKEEKESEIECADRFWKLHQERNDSIITDLFSGLLKSDVICNECGFHNITFDPCNTLTLAIPDSNYLSSKKAEKIDIELFYIPKFSIKRSCYIKIHINKDTPFKDMAGEMNKIEGFKYNLKNLIYIKVLDSKLQEFIDQNKCKTLEKEFIFAFDDESKEEEKTKIIPLYMFKDEDISAFPRLLFLRENMSFGELKKLIYYFARSYFRSPFRKEEENEVSQVEKELEKYKKNDDDDEEKNKCPYDENKLWDLFGKEYNEIFNNNDKNKEELEKFFNDFPYKITIKKKFADKEEFILFDGNNNLDNLKSLQITKDEDPINALFENKDYCLNLVLNSLSKNSIQKFNLNTYEKHFGKNVGKKYKFDITLDDLLEYFCSIEHLEKGNEWKCGKCKNKTQIKKKFSLFYLPKLLIICFNRFSKGGYGYGYGKNDEFIDFPLENLDMGKYICESGPDKEFSKYDLFAVSQHYGGTGGGHYTAICKNYDGKWYSYNDSSVSSASPGNVVSSAAYVLFYRRKNW